MKKKLTSQFKLDKMMIYENNILKSEMIRFARHFPCNLYQNKTEHIFIIYKYYVYNQHQLARFRSIITCR